MCVSVCLCVYVRVGVCRLKGLSFFYTCFLLSVMIKKQRNFKDTPHGDAAFLKNSGCLARERDS